MQIDSRVVPPTQSPPLPARTPASQAVWTAPHEKSAGAAPLAVAPPTPTEAQRFTRLNRLVQALGRDFGVRLRAGDAWGYVPQDRVVTCPPQDLAAHTDAYNIGKVCRELARLRYSRQAPAAAAAQPLLHYLWQLEESLRVSKLMAARYAGARSMLAEVAYTDRPMPITNNDAQGPVPPVVQWGEACLAQWGGDPRPVDNAQAQAALQALQPLLGAITAPPSHVDLRFDDLTPDEMQRAADAARIAVEERLLPEVLKLWPPQERPPPQDNAPPSQNEAPPPGSGGGHGDPAGADAAPPSPPQPPQQSHKSHNATIDTEQALNQAIARLLPQLQAVRSEMPPPPEEPAEASRESPGPAQPNPQPAGLEGTPGRTYTDAKTAPESVDLEAQLQALRVPYGYYEALCNDLAQDIDAMEHALEEAFEACRHPKPQGYYESGRFHLPRALQADFRRQATGITESRLYRRKTPPTQRSVGFVLVLDRSGSMQGERIANLQRAATVLLEPARRLQMDVGIISYDWRAHALKSPTDDLSPAACTRLMEQLSPHGNNNEQAALDAAQTMAEQIDADEVYIIFVTDGGGDPRITQRIAALEHEHPSMKVVGVGIGPGCTEVPRLYPRHLSVSSVSALPQRLAELFIGLHHTLSEEP